MKKNDDGYTDSVPVPVPVLRAMPYPKAIKKVILLAGKQIVVEVSQSMFYAQFYYNPRNTMSIMWIIVFGLHILWIIN